MHGVEEKAYFWFLVSILLITACIGVAVGLVIGYTVWT